MIDVDVTQGSVRSADGTVIAYARSGDGPPLVLVHGTTADRNRWRTVLEPLQKRFTVYAIDRRGRGGSGDAEPYALEREFEDVVAVVDSIGRPVNLLGHSYGALVALEAATRSSNIARLVLYEPPLPVDIPIYPEGSLERLEALIDAGNREGALVSFMRDIVGLPEDQLTTLRSLPAWQGRLAAAHTLARECRAEMTYTPDTEAFLGLGAPTLLLMGGESPPFLTEPIHVLAKHLPDARVAVMPGQHHAAMDTGPDVFLKEVLAFLGDR